MASDILPCPFCGDRMMLREALWPSEGDTDAVIHSGPSDCPMPAFDLGVADGCTSVIEAWNRRALPQPSGDAVERLARIIAEHFYERTVSEPSGSTRGSWMKAVVDKHWPEFTAIAIAALPAAEPEHIRDRWNIDRDGDDLVICFNEHEKGEKCEYVRYVRSDALPASDAGVREAVLEEIAAERRRQVEVEDFDASHDDMATRGQLAGAAACYAINGIDHWARAQAVKTLWPWANEWWKPKGRRRDLVRAAALLIAEIERLDRALRSGGAS